MAVVMAVKEDAELKTIQRACQVTCDVFSKYLKEQIMEVIDNDKVNIWIFWNMSHVLRKPVFGEVGPGKIQTSLPSYRG